MKRKLYILLSLVIAASLALAACGGGGATCRPAGGARHWPCWWLPPAVAAALPANSREERSTGRAGAGHLLSWRRCRSMVSDFSARSS